VFELESLLFVVGGQAVDLEQHRQQVIFTFAGAVSTAHKAMAGPSGGVQNHRKSMEIEETSSRYVTE
jgi:hypothetical protein